MAVKIFILGLPGSGKSTISHHIADYVGERHWSTTHIYDYEILLQMYQGDTKGQFRSAGHGGFDVLHLPVFDIALKELEQNVITYLSTALLKEIVLIEFSRNNYEGAFQQFNQEFLQDSYFLYLNVEREICKKRLRERTAAPNTSNDHYVSEYIFDTYYIGDDGIDLPRILKRNYSIDSLKVRVINNSASQEDSAYLNEQFEEIQRFIDYIIENETPRLQETEPMKIYENEEVKSELEHN